MGFVLSFCITFGNKSSQKRVSFWTGGLDPVSVVLTGGLGALWLIWSKTKRGTNSQIFTSCNQTPNKRLTIQVRSIGFSYVCLVSPGL